MKNDLRSDTYLKSFGVVSLSDTFTELPKAHGLVYKGMISAYDFMLSGMNQVNRQLFRLKAATHPKIQLFGDIWGKGYDVENQMINHIIHYLRTRKVTWDWSRLLVSKQEVLVLAGLKLDISNSLLSDAERQAIAYWVEISGTKFDVNFDDYKWESAIEIVRFQRDLDENRKLLRPIKEFVDKTINSRIQAVYSPYSKKEKDKLKKARISDLVDKIKGDIAYFPFNPTNVLIPLGGSKLPDVPPSTDEGWDSMMTRYRTWSSTVSSPSLLRIADSLAAEYRTYSVTFPSGT